MRHLLRSFTPATLRVAGLGALLLTAACSSQDPSEEGFIDVQRYDLKGRFDWDRSVLSATLGVTLRSNVDGLEHVVLDSGVSRITGVKVAGGDALPFDTDLETHKL